MRISNQPLIHPALEKHRVQLFVKREDQLHPLISGNKFRKLKYNIKEAQRQEKDTLLTFGGAYSNHILAVAAAGYENSFKTIGVIRGEELENKILQNPTLKKAQELGMTFFFVSRSDYREKTTPQFLQILQEKFNDFYLIPEGGTNNLAVQGCEEILTDKDGDFNVICSAVGTGGTISGLINSVDKHQTVLGFPALKGEFLTQEIQPYVRANNWKLIHHYHFGGYAKVNEELINFINDVFLKNQLPLDPVYTGKMIYGIVDLVKQNYFSPNTKILAIHTGGLQGIDGMNKLLIRKNMPQILTEQ